MQYACTHVQRIHSQLASHSRTHDGDQYTTVYIQEQRAFDQVLYYREETMLNKATRCICQKKKLIETDQTDSLSTLLITQK